MDYKTGSYNYNLNMKFIRFLNSQNKKALAKKLGCSVISVYMWGRRETFPKRPLAKKLIEISEGNLTYDDIYAVSEEEEKSIQDLKNFQEDKKKIDEKYKKLKESFKASKKNP